MSNTATDGTVKSGDISVAHARLITLLKSPQVDSDRALDAVASLVSMARRLLASLPDAPTPDAIAKQEQDVDTLNEIAGWLRNLVYTNDATADQAENYACDLEILASPPDAPPSAPEAAPRGELPTRGAFLARVSELCTSHPDCLAAPFSNHIETAWRLAFLELQGAIP
jgi:hypothetical protein